MGKNLRDLLKKGAVFIMGPVEKQSFEDIREALSSKMVLVCYDPSLKTRIYTDACVNGISYVLFQKHDKEKCWCGKDEKTCVCRWRIVWCNSRALKPSFVGLPPLYLEAIGHHWALNDAAFYLKGSKDGFEAITDHYSLVSLTNKPLPDLPEKLKDLFMDLRGFNYNTTFISGARNIISDSLCRAVKWASKVKNGPEDEVEDEALDKDVTGGIERGFARMVTSRDNSLSYVWKDPMFEEIIKQAGKDTDYMKVAELVKERRNIAYLKSKLSKNHPARGYLCKWDLMGTETCPKSGVVLMTLHHHGDNNDSG